MKSCHNAVAKTHFVDTLNELEHNCAPSRNDVQGDELQEILKGWTHERTKQIEAGFFAGLQIGELLLQSLMKLQSSLPGLPEFGDYQLNPRQSWVRLWGWLIYAPNVPPIYRKQGVGTLMIPTVRNSLLDWAVGCVNEPRTKCLNPFGERIREALRSLCRFLAFAAINNNGIPQKFYRSAYLASGSGARVLNLGQPTRIPNRLAQPFIFYSLFQKTAAPVLQLKNQAGKE